MKRFWWLLVAMVISLVVAGICYSSGNGVTGEYCLLASISFAVYIITHAYLTQQERNNPEIKFFVFKISACCMGIALIALILEIILGGRMADFCLGGVVGFVLLILLIAEKPSLTLSQNSLLKNKGSE